MGGILGKMRGAIKDSPVGGFTKGVAKAVPSEMGPWLGLAGRAGALVGGGAALYMGGAALLGAGGATTAAAAPTAGTAGGIGATQMGYAGTSVGSGVPAGYSAGTSSAGWQDYARQGSQMGNQGGGGGGGEYVQEDYSAEDEQRQYWAGRGMELRAMADAAVRRYLS